MGRQGGGGLAAQRGATSVSSVGRIAGTVRGCLWLPRRVGNGRPRLPPFIFQPSVLHDGDFLAGSEPFSDVGDS